MPSDDSDSRCEDVDMPLEDENSKKGVESAEQSFGQSLPEDVMVGVSQGVIIAELSSQTSQVDKAGQDIPKVAPQLLVHFSVAAVLYQ